MLPDSDELIDIEKICVRCEEAADGSLEIEVEGDAADYDWDQLAGRDPDDALCMLLAWQRGNGEWEVFGPRDLGRARTTPELPHFDGGALVTDGCTYPDSNEVVVWGNLWVLPLGVVTDTGDPAVASIVQTLKRGGVLRLPRVRERIGDPRDCEVCNRTGCGPVCGEDCRTCSGRGMIFVKLYEED